MVQMWWDVLAELPEADRVRVLRWSTGWPALPAGGWGPRRFTLRALSIGPDHLPVRAPFLCAANLEEKRVNDRTAAQDVQAAV